MLRFIYQHDYDDSVPAPRCLFGIRHNTGANKSPLSDLIEHPPQDPDRLFWNGEALIVNTKMCIIAEKLSIGLTKHAAEKYEEAAGELWRTLNSVRSIELFFSFELDDKSRWPMRCAIVDIIVRNSPVLLREKKIRQLLTLHGDLATEVLSLTVNGGRLVVTQQQGKFAFWRHSGGRECKWFIEKSLEFQKQHTK